MVNDPESYASGSVATGRASHATQVKSDDPHNKGYPGPHVGVRCGANNPTPLRITVTELTGSQSPPSAVVLLLLLLKMMMTKKDQV